MTQDTLRDRTIADFDDQWTRYTENEGWYGSLEMFRDIVEPLVPVESIRGQRVVDIGSGSGRIVRMLLAAGAGHVTAVEPAPGAAASLRENLREHPRAGDVEVQETTGEAWSVAEPADLVVSIGVVHHIPDPDPVVRRAREQLRSGGRLFLWLYGREGNETYLTIAQPIRRVTVRLPYFALRTVVEGAYWTLAAYRQALRVARLPMGDYIQNVLWPMTPANRRLVIYDQLNPAYAKYYRRAEAIDLLERNGFVDVRIHHRHGYSWSVVGTRRDAA